MRDAYYKLHGQKLTCKIIDLLIYWEVRANSSIQNCQVVQPGLYTSLMLILGLKRVTSKGYKKTLFKNVNLLFTSQKNTLGSKT